MVEMRRAGCLVCGGGCGVLGDVVAECGEVILSGVRIGG